MIFQSSLICLPYFCFSLFKSELIIYIFSDVVGVMQGKASKREYVNDKQEPKTQLKFSITDGRFIIFSIYIHSQYHFTYICQLHILKYYFTGVLEK